MVGNTVGGSSSLDTMPSTTNFPCNACGLVFDDSQTQRGHMREPWQYVLDEKYALGMDCSHKDSVYNLKRRMASLPPISAQEYAENEATDPVRGKLERSNALPSSAKTKSSPKRNIPEEHDQSGHVRHEQDRINCCLFCNNHSHSSESNLEHMSSEHGLYIPEVEHLSNLDIMIRYLRTVVTEYNECLYCGMTKPSTAGIRQHMLDRGHCMINLDREPELLEFWSFSNSDNSDDDNDITPKVEARETDGPASGSVLQDEYTLPSGKVIRSKDKAREALKFARRITSSTQGTSTSTVTENPNNQNSEITLANTTDLPTNSQRGDRNRTIATRDACGLVGLSNQQLRSLSTIQRKSQRQQAIVRASASWADERGGVHQKHYKQKMNLRDG